MNKSHDWKLSWPGNSCKRCFQEDLTEICVAEGCCFENCDECTEESNKKEQCIFCLGTGVMAIECNNIAHKNGYCPG